jgi:hypothetical protein
VRLSECRIEDVSRLQHGATLKDAELSTFQDAALMRLSECRTALSKFLGCRIERVSRMQYS